MESLSEYRSRLKWVWDSLPREGCFETNPNLREKVGEDGRLLPFFGDTMLYILSESERSRLAGLQRELYAACGELLAEPLDAAGLHLTLHDLNASPEPGRVAGEMARSREAALAVLRELPDELRQPIAVRSTAAFSMVNTSVVMGFEPCDEACCDALMALYERFQRVVRLNYPLTLHVTLAYYRPGNYGEARLWQLRDALSALNRESDPVTLRLGIPAYSRFTDMNHYQPEA